MHTLTKLSTTALALLMIGTASAGAACKPNQVYNKNWKFTAADSNNVNKYLFNCTFRTLSDGTINPDPTGCNYFVAGVGTFATATNLALTSGNFTVVANQTCTYDVTMVWNGGATFTGRAVFESGKTIANGTWYSNFTGYGSFSVMRQ